MSARPLISAHRGGAGSQRQLENSREALSAASKLDCELVEFDVQCCRDNSLVISHDNYLRLGKRRQRLADINGAQLNNQQLLTYRQALQLVAAGQKIAHIDIKFANNPEAERIVVQQAREIMEPNNFIVTTLEDSTVYRLRRWSRDQGNQQLAVGLSLGRQVNHLPLFSQIATRAQELFPGRRLRRTNSNLLVSEQRLVRYRLGYLASKLNKPLLVWTVDDHDELEYWLRHPAVWALTTNFPQRAISIRNRIYGQQKNADANI